MRLALASHRDHLHAFQRIYQYPLVLREFLLEEILQKIIELFRVINDSAEIRETDICLFERVVGHYFYISIA